MTEETASTAVFWVSVVVPTPAHSGLGDALCYRSERALTPGTLVRVPLGHREALGVVWDTHEAPPEGLNPDQVRGVSLVLDARDERTKRWVLGPA